jgi:hypothetical protein
VEASVAASIAARYENPPNSPLRFSPPIAHHAVLKERILARGKARADEAGSISQWVAQGFETANPFAGAGGGH